MTTVYQCGKGDNYLGDVYLGDKISNKTKVPTSNFQDKYTPAALLVKVILDELSETFNPNSLKGQKIISTAALISIEGTQGLKKNLIECIKNTGLSNLVIFIDHPSAQVVIEEFVVKHM